MKYLITYDLHAPEKEYTPLIAAIKAYGKWAKIGRSCWAIKTSQSAAAIRDKLHPLLDSDDVLFVCPFSDWASTNLSDQVVNWLVD